MTSYKPCRDDLSWNYDLDFLDHFNDWDILLKVNNDMNNGANTTDINIENQDHQDYYDQRDQQHILIASPTMV